MLWFWAGSGSWGPNIYLDIHGVRLIFLRLRSLSSREIENADSPPAFLLPSGGRHVDEARLPSEDSPPATGGDSKDLAVARRAELRCEEDGAGPVRNLFPSLPSNLLQTIADIDSAIQGWRRLGPLLDAAVVAGRGR